MSKIALKTIIAEFLSSADLSEHQFMKIWNYGVRAQREFNMDIYGSFKSVLLQAGEAMTCELPADYLAFSKLGILNDSGEVVTLTENNDISPIHQQYVSAVQKVVQVPFAGSSIFNNGPAIVPNIWFNFIGWGGLGYHLYGLPGGTVTVGEYRISDADKLIYLSADWPYGYVLLEYLSDGYDCEADDYMVDVRASEAMVAWIRWKNAQDSRKKFSNGDVAYYKTEYYRERRLAKMRINSVDIDQMQKVFRSKVKLAAKA